MSADPHSFHTLARLHTRLHEVPSLSAPCKCVGSLSYIPPVQRGHDGAQRSREDVCQVVVMWTGPICRESQWQEPEPSLLFRATLRPGPWWLTLSEGEDEVGMWGGGLNWPSSNVHRGVILEKVIWCLSKCVNVYTLTSHTSPLAYTHSYVNP